MMKRFLTGVLSIIAGTALVLTSFAGACSEDAGSETDPPPRKRRQRPSRGLLEPFPKRKQFRSLTQNWNRSGSKPWRPRTVHVNGAVVPGR